MEETYLSKVKETWIPQFPRRLANIRIRVLIFDDGLKHLDSIILVGKETGNHPFVGNALNLQSFHTN